MAREAGSSREPHPGGGERDCRERLVAEELARRSGVQAGAHQLVPQLDLVGPAEPRSEHAADQACKLVERPAEPRAWRDLSPLTRVSVGTDLADCLGGAHAGHRNRPRHEGDRRSDEEDGADKDDDHGRPPQTLMSTIFRMTIDPEMTMSAAIRRRNRPAVFE